MNRSDFFKNIAGAAAAPTLLKDILNITDDDKVVISEPKGKKIAIDIHALTAACSIHGPGGKKITPKEILDIYFKTGILIYSSVRPDGSEILHNPIQVIE